jgi:hypothetical protein
MRNSDRPRQSIRVFLLAGVFAFATVAADADDGYQLGHGYDVGPLNFAGYADATAQLPQHDAGSLVLNDLSLFISGHFDRLFNPFTEVELAELELLTWHSDRLHEGGGDIALERLYNDSYLTDSLTLRLGKMLSPVGEWNVIHASPLVLSEIRPAVTYRDFSEYATGASIIYSDPESRLPDIQIYWQPNGELSERPRRLTYDSYRDVEGVHVSFASGLLDKFGVSYQHSTDIQGTDQSLFGADYHYTAGQVTFQGEATYSTLSGPPSLNGRNSEWGAYSAVSYALDEHWSGYVWYEAFRDRSLTATAQDLLFGIAYHFQPALLMRLEYVQNIGGQPVNPTGLFLSGAVLF